MRVTRSTLLGVTLMLAALPALAEEPEVLVELDRTKVYEGQPVRYRVTLNHVENPSPPELTGFDGFEVTPLGEQSLDSTSVTIVNDRVTRIVRRGRQYNYRLTPLKTGLLTIPSPVAKVDGRVLKGPERMLQVRPADEQDIVSLEITSDRTSVYPMQPFTRPPPSAGPSSTRSSPGRTGSATRKSSAWRRPRRWRPSSWPWQGFSPAGSSPTWPSPPWRLRCCWPFRPPTTGTGSTTWSTASPQPRQSCERGTRPATSRPSPSRWRKEPGSE